MEEKSQDRRGLSSEPPLPRARFGIQYPVMIRFHLTSGARLSLRSAAPAAGVVVLAVGLSPNPGATFEALAEQLTTSKVPLSPAPLAAVLLCFALAFSACRLVVPAVRGWLRHLPVSGPAHFRAITVALLAAQSPVLLAWLGLWLYGSASGTAVSWSRLALIPVAGGAAALSAATWAWAKRSRRHRTPARSGSPAPPRFLPVIIAWRAVGPRLVQAIVTAALPLAALNLFIRNNDLPRHLAEGAGRFAAALAVSALTVYLVMHLSLRRPVWPWFRSLPRSSGQRVLGEAFLLWVHGAPFLAAAFIILLPGPASVAAVLAVSWLIALRGAAALRRERNTRMGVSGSLLLECLFLCAWTGVTPLAGLAWLILAPLAHRAAVRLEREARVYRWEERHHREIGDPLTWRAR